MIIFSCICQCCTGCSIEIKLKCLSYTGPRITAILIQPGKPAAQNCIGRTGDGMFCTGAELIVTTSSAPSSVQVMCPGEFAAWTCNNTFIDIQNAVIVIIYVVHILDTIAVGVHTKVIAIVEISSSGYCVTAIGSCIVISVCQLESTSIMAQSTDVGIVVSRFMCCTVIQPVVTNCCICASVIISVVITETTFGNIKFTIVVTVQIKTIWKVISICIDLRNTISLNVSAVQTIVGKIRRSVICNERNVISRRLRFNVVCNTIVVTVEIKMIHDAVVVAVDSIFRRRLR